MKTVNFNKFFDVKGVLDSAEKNTKFWIDYIPNEALRDVSNRVSIANFDLVRTQAIAMQNFYDSMTKVLED